jgi:hypothetical protein
MLNYQKNGGNLPKIGWVLFFRIILIIMSEKSNLPENNWLGLSPFTPQLSP